MTTSAVVPLTNREREIGALAASGATSRQIAERLYVSVRTVDNHLQSIYAKLDISSRVELAEAVLATPPLTALLLTCMIEWFTQRHYVEHVRDSDELDPLFRDLLRYHWIDESRHARMDTLLIAEEAAEMSPDEREAAIDALLELGTAVDGLLAAQADLDLEALARATHRDFSGAEVEEILHAQRRSYRWTFLVSGLEHPNFVRVIEDLSPTGAAKVEATARALAARHGSREAARSAARPESHPIRPDRARRYGEAASRLHRPARRR